MRPLANASTTLFAAVLVGWLAAVPAAAVVYTVGAVSDAACTHHTLPAALLAAAAAGNDEVRLARNLAYTNEVVHLTNWGAGNALTIAGGYDNCADTTASGTTAIDGTSAPVVEVDTTAANTSTVTLRRLTLTGSSARGLLVEGNSTVTLANTLVTGNSGGGIDLTAGTTVTVDFFSAVDDNGPTDWGAGIRCVGGHLLLSGIVGNAGAPNVANWGGGGIFADAGCDVDLLDGAVVQANQAIDGGGLYAAGGSQVGATGASFGISISVNDAEQQGGGVFAIGSGTSVSLVNTVVAANQAANGGGLYAHTDAVITMDQNNAALCGDVDNCSRLTGNGAVTGGFSDGAAAGADSGGHIDVYETLVNGNLTGGTSAGVGEVFYGRGAGSRLRLEGVTFYANDAGYLVGVSSGSTAEVAFVTASRNGRSAPDFATPARPLLVGDGSTARVNSSIFWPNGPFSVNTGGSIAEADCLIVSSTVGLPGGATLISTLDPQFRNAAAGNLRPGPFSPAIDFCDATMYAPTHQDRDGENRGYDLGMNANGSPGIPGGVFDLGADEVRDFLFYEGFEGGTLGAWSADWP